MILTFLAAAVFLPLAGLLLTAARRRLEARRIAQLACVAMAASALSALIAFVAWLVGSEIAPQRLVLAGWIRAGEVDMAWALRADSLSLLMAAVVSSVSALVHVYALAYMKRAPGLIRFYAYLGLFTFAMLTLATSDNLLQLFFGWEGVGLCSYLLIGFRHERDKASRAAVKAFIVNRVGDFALLLGVVGLFVMYGSLQFDALFAAASSPSHMGAHAVLMALLLLGAMGKSAQLGLHSWLPDAMEGPAPVSALIHAATMVTAGVFLLVRLSPLFAQAPDVLVIIALIGGATSLFAAVCAFAQNDIKRMIAWSTCSQLGYMFLALGVAAWGAAIFHLVTHAFFKALLFLGAGAVIHATGGVQDLRAYGVGREGGWLARAMPLTCAFMWAGALALAGAPFLSGYYSKDLILEAAWGASAASPWLASALAMALAAALVTAAYSLRLLVSVFHKKADDAGAPSYVARLAHAPQMTAKPPRDPPLLMLVPMGVLALGAVVAGLLGSGAFSAVQENGWWRGAVDAVSNAKALQGAHDAAGGASWLPLLLAVLGAFSYWLLGVRRVLLPLPTAAARFLARFFPPARAATLVMTPARQVMAAFRAVADFLRRGWRVDELYRRLFVAPTGRLASNLARVAERDIIDSLGATAVAAAVRRAGRFVAALHNGRVHAYAFTVLAALAVLLAWRAAGVLGDKLP